MTHCCYFFLEKLKYYSQTHNESSLPRGKLILQFKLYEIAYCLTIDFSFSLIHNIDFGASLISSEMKSYIFVKLTI